MRFLVIAIAAALLLPPAKAPAEAGDAAQHSANAAATDLSAKKHTKPMKKTAKAKKEKVEYMRAAPM
jgi:hypothetical protein